MQAKSAAGSFAGNPDNLFEEQAAQYRLSVAQASVATRAFWDELLYLSISTFGNDKFM
jgi:ribonuclease HIII